MKQKLPSACVLLASLTAATVAGMAHADGAPPAPAPAPNPAPAPAPAPAPSAAPAPKASLYVTANGFKGTQGQALIALYASKGTWLKIDRAVKLVKTKITGSNLTVVFSDLPPGEYAVSVIHDANANGKLDMHWFPIPGPDEGAGVSNDATATFGPPSYDDSRIRVGESNGMISVSVRY